MLARLPFVSREDLPESERHIYDEAARSRGSTKIGRPFEALMSSPEAAARAMAVGTYLRFQTKLPETLRELVTTVVAHEMDCDIERAGHANLARKVGVSEASIAAVLNGKAPAGLQPEEASVVKYALELLRTHHAKDETFNAVHKQLGTKNLVDLTMVIAYYTMVSIAFNAVDLKAADMQSK
ncbi:MAG: carboxymuconolactone decarboxylase family protein [Dehalococcoidales bacterium]|nr:carboxymuconolactone decarboxylase family protein [Dehalococcoidales bacterium]